MHEIFGPYQLIERLASGGMAEIFKARTFGHSGFEKTLVIKRLHPRCTQNPEFIEMLKEEAKTAVGLSHANIVQIFDLGRVQEHYYIAMEYINGRDLRQWRARLKEQRAFIPPEAALYLVSELCSGLDFAHRQRDAQGQLLRLIHRDVSPHNVMISSEGEVKIVDFGIAKSLATHQETEAGVIKGKFCFMSPEQASGQRLDHRTDIFSAGIILYELLTGRAMYESDNDHDLIKIVKEARFVPIEELRPDLPRALHKVVNKALAPNRDQRYPSARHFQHAIEKVMQRSGLMFSRFQLGQLLVSYFGELSANHESVFNSYDDFGLEEHSLISDYQPPNTARGDWDVPEFTDEIDEFEELDVLDEEDNTDASALHSATEPRGLPKSMARLATPVPASSHQQHNASVGFAPAAPPMTSGPPSTHMYHSQSVMNAAQPAYAQPGPSKKPVAGYPSAASHQSAALDQRSLYSSEEPPLNSMSQLYEQGMAQHRRRDMFEPEVESTMILEDQPVTPRKGREQENIQRVHSRRGAQWSTSPSLQAKLNTLKNQVLAHPYGRHALIALGFLLLFMITMVFKSVISTPERAPTQKLKIVSAGTPSLSAAESRSALTPSDPIETPTASPLSPSRVLVNAEPVARGGQRPSDDMRARRRRTAPVTRSRQSSSMNSFTSESQALGAEPISGSVYITSKPSGAEVAIDDEWQSETTPLIAQMTLNEQHSLTFSRADYQEKVVRIVPKNANAKIEVKLSPLRGRLVIRSSPEKVLVRHQGRLIGETPLIRDDWPLSPTEFQMEVSKSGYQSKLLSFNWLNADRGVIDVEVVLEPNPKPVSSKPRRRRPRARAKKKSRRRASRPSGYGFLSVKSGRWGELLVDGRPVKRGKVILRHKVNAGSHRVPFCFNADRGNCAQKRVSISKGAHEKVFF